MKKTYLRVLIVFLFLLIGAVLVPDPLLGKSENPKAAKPETKCRLKFDLKSWSIFYKSGKGEGVITCDNGQKAAVKIRTHGGGVTFGKSKIVDGHGSFSKVHDIHELFGGYAESAAHAGASGSSDARAMWNGDISLSVAGTGKGWDLGFNFGQFKITPK